MNELEHFEKDSLFDRMAGDEERLVMKKFKKVNVTSGEYFFKEN